MPGGHPMNPLGVRALYLGASAYRIHGTDAPWTIGTASVEGVAFACTIRTCWISIHAFRLARGDGDWNASSHLAITPQPPERRATRSRRCASRIYPQLLAGGPRGGTACQGRGPRRGTVETSDARRARGARYRASDLSSICGPRLGRHFALQIVLPNWSRSMIEPLVAARGFASQHISL